MAGIRSPSPSTSNNFDSANRSSERGGRFLSDLFDSRACSEDRPVRSDRWADSIGADRFGNSGHFERVPEGARHAVDNAHDHHRFDNDGRYERVPEGERHAVDNGHDHQPTRTSRRLSRYSRSASPDHSKSPSRNVTGQKVSKDKARQIR